MRGQASFERSFGTIGVRDGELKVDRERGNRKKWVAYCFKRQMLVKVLIK